MCEMYEFGSGKKNEETSENNIQEKQRKLTPLDVHNTLIYFKLHLQALFSEYGNVPDLTFECATTPNDINGNPRKDLIIFIKGKLGEDITYHQALYFTEDTFTVGHPNISDSNLYVNAYDAEHAEILQEEKYGELEEKIRQLSTTYANKLNGGKHV